MDVAHEMSQNFWRAQRLLLIVLVLCQTGAGHDPDIDPPLNRILSVKVYIYQQNDPMGSA